MDLFLSLEEDLPDVYVDDGSLKTELYDIFSQAASVGDTFFMFFLVASILMSIRERNSVAVTSDTE